MTRRLLVLCAACAVLAFACTPPEHEDRHASCLEIMMDGDDSCEWAHDGYCDDVDCTEGTDATDCAEEACEGIGEPDDDDADTEGSSWSWDEGSSTDAPSSGGDTYSGGDTSSSSSFEVDCTYPNDPSICGCGNACQDSSGTCEDCGSRGAGCLHDDIYCCADADCPSGMYCSTLSSSASIGYHLCVTAADMTDCATDADCWDGEVCRSGLCRENE